MTAIFCISSERARKFAACSGQKIVSVGWGDAELREASTPLDVQEQAARVAIRVARGEIGALDAQAEEEEEQERNLQRLATAVARAATIPPTQR